MDTQAELEPLLLIDDRRYARFEYERLYRREEQVVFNFEIQAFSEDGDMLSLPSAVKRFYRGVETAIAVKQLLTMFCIGKNKQDVDEITRGWEEHYR